MPVTSEEPTLKLKWPHLSSNNNSYQATRLVSYWHEIDSKHVFRIYVSDISGSTPSDWGPRIPVDIRIDGQIKAFSSISRLFLRWRGVKFISKLLNTRQSSQPSNLRQLFTVQLCRSTQYFSLLPLLRPSITPLLKFVEIALNPQLACMRVRSSVYTCLQKLAKDETPTNNKCLYNNIILCSMQWISLQVIVYDRNCSPFLCGMRLSWNM